MNNPYFFVACPPNAAALNSPLASGMSEQVAAEVRRLLLDATGYFNGPPDERATWTIEQLIEALHKERLALFQIIQDKDRIYHDQQKNFDRLLTLAKNEHVHFALPPR